MPLRILPSLLALFLITACSGISITSTDPAAKEVISRSIRQYSSENWEIRKIAVARAAEYTDSAYTKNLVLFFLMAVNDPHPLVRVESLKALKKMKARSAMKKIQDIALYDPDVTVRWAAFSALEEYRSAENEKAFITGCADSDWLIRESAIRGLLKIDDLVVQERNVDLILLMMNDSNISVRIETLNNVVYKDKRIYLELSRLINNKNTGRTLLKSALIAVSGYRLDTTTRKRLIRLLTHSNNEIRVLAYRALKKDDELKGL